MALEPLSVRDASFAETTPTIDPSFVCSTNDLLGYNVLRPLGVVRGITVRSRNIAADIGAGFKSLVGGEIKTFTTLCETARKEALERMLEQAIERGANGVVAVRYDTNQIAPNVTEVIAYGMAVSDTNVATGAAASAENESIHSGWVCVSNELPGRSVHQSLGVVNGITVRSRNIVMGVGAGLKSLVGGEIKTWTKMCEDARSDAYMRMVEDAAQRGADGIVAVRYSTNEVCDGITEVVAYGTAVSSNSQGPSASNAVSSDRANATATTAASAETIPAHMVTTSTSLPGLSANSSFGMVKGLSVRSSNLMRSIGAGFKSLAGGEIKNWTKMCTETRAIAFERMLEEAKRMGAKGIVGMRYDASQVQQNAVVEVIAYGTAVSDEPLQHPASSANCPRHMVSTNLQIPGHLPSRSLGVVRGISIQSVNFFRHVGAGFKTIVGGEINNYTQMCENAREQAFEDMMKHASEMGATGVIGMRFVSNDLVPGVIEVVAYGTAVSDGTRTPMEGFVAEALGPIDSACLSTTNDVIGQPFARSIGVVRGITVRSRNFFAGFGASMKATFVGGQIHTWIKLCEGARIEATKRLVEEAAACGARGVVGLRYETNEVTPGVTEVLAFGTAVA